MACYTESFCKLKIYTGTQYGHFEITYHSLINSKLQYGTIVWGAKFKTYLSELTVRIIQII